MGDYRFSTTEEAFAEDLWLLEDSRTAPAIEKYQINICGEFGFSPYLEQGISLLEEISSIEDNGLYKEKASIDHQLQNSIFSTLLINASYDPDNMFVERDSDTFHNKTCISRVEQLSDTNPSAGKRSLVKGIPSKIKERKSKFKNSETEKRGTHIEVLEEDSLAKKQDHNAKERMRRTKLHASYLALGSLLPISKTSKKRWTAPVIIDKVIDYIPELESEIEQLTRKKNTMISAVENRQLLVTNKKDPKAKALTVSVNKVKQRELILQICIKRNEAINVFSNLLQKMEDESIHVVSTSTLHVSEERECYTIHIQMNESSSSRDDYVTALKEQLISWLS